MMRSHFKYSEPIVPDEEDSENREELTFKTSSLHHPHDLNPGPKTIEYESNTSPDKTLDIEESDVDSWEDSGPEEDLVDDDEPRCIHNEETIELESWPRQKRQKLDIPVLKTCAAAHRHKNSILQSAFLHIQNFI